MSLGNKIKLSIKTKKEIKTEGATLVSGCNLGFADKKMYGQQSNMSPDPLFTFGWKKTILRHFRTIYSHELIF
jgi:hypothetical protein